MVRKGNRIPPRSWALRQTSVFPLDRKREEDLEVKRTVYKAEEYAEFWFRAAG